MKANPNKYGLIGWIQEKYIAPPLIPAMPISKAGPQQQANGAIAATIEPSREMFPIFAFIVLILR